MHPCTESPHRSQSAPGPGLHTTPRAVAAAALLLLAGCTSQPGPTLTQAVPDLEERTGAPLPADAPWDTPSSAWDGRAPLSADAALHVAMQNNRSLRRALLEVEQRRALYQDSQLAPNPVVQLGAGVPLDMGATPLLAMLGAQVDWLWKRDATIGAADARLRSALFEAAALTVATAVEVRAAYADVASAAQIHALSNADAEVAQRVLDATTAEFKAGLARGEAVNDARINWAEASTRQVEAQQALVVAKTRLLKSMGRGDLGLDWTTKAQDIGTALVELALPETPAPQDQQDLVALVQQQRLDLRAAQARVEGAQQRVALARANVWPSLMLGGGWEKDMEGDQAAMFQAQITLPLFNQGQHRIKAAEVELEMARLELDAVMQQALLDAHRALGALAMAEHHTVQIRDVSLAAFTDNKRLLGASVQRGETAPLRLWQSEHQENHLRIQLAKAQRDAAMAALDFQSVLAGARLPDAPQPSMASAPVGMGAFSLTAQEGMQ